MSMLRYSLRGSTDSILKMTQRKDLQFESQPNISKLINGLNRQTMSFNTVRFENFRIALKVKTLMNKLKLTHLDYKQVLFHLNQGGIAFGRRSMNISTDQSRTVLRSILGTLSKVHFSDVQLDELVDAVGAIFDRILDIPELSPSNQYHRSVNANAFRLLLFALLNMNLSMKLIYLFQMSSYPDTSISEENLRILFTILLRIAHCVEARPSAAEKLRDDAYQIAGVLINDLVSGRSQTFSLHEDEQSQVSIDKNTYLDFMNDHRPDAFEWLHALHKVISASGVRHDAQCDVCQAYPIAGLRYRCMQCLNYDLCSTCYLTGAFSKDHLPTHDMEEHERRATPLEDMKALFGIVKNKLILKRDDNHTKRTRSLMFEGRPSISTIRESKSLASTTNRMSAQRPFLKTSQTNGSLKMPVNASVDCTTNPNPTMNTTRVIAGPRIQDDGCGLYDNVVLANNLPQMNERRKRSTDFPTNRIEVVDRSSAAEANGPYANCSNVAPQILSSSTLRTSCMDEIESCTTIVKRSTGRIIETDSSNHSQRSNNDRKESINMRLTRSTFETQNSGSDASELCYMKSDELW